MSLLECPEVIDWGDCVAGGDTTWEIDQIEELFLPFWLFDRTYSPVEAIDSEIQFRLANGTLSNIALVDSGHAFQFRLLGDPEFTKIFLTFGDD